MMRGSRFTEKDCEDDFTSMIGCLDDFELPLLLRMLALNRNSGCVHVRRDRGISGEVWLQDGAPIDAHTGDAQGEEAALQLLAGRGGRFKVAFGRWERTATIELSMEQLLLEAAKATDLRNVARSSTAQACPGLGMDVRVPRNIARPATDRTPQSATYRGRLQSRTTGHGSRTPRANSSS